LQLKRSRICRIGDLCRDGPAEPLSSIVITSRVQLSRGLTSHD
jgi:hypothetical protein